MKSCNAHSVITLICLFAFLPICLYADSDPLLELHQKKFRWMIEMKLDSLETILAEDLLYVHSNGWVETKEEVIANIKSEHLAYNKVEIEDQSVRYFDNTGIVSGRAVFHVALDGEPLVIELLYSEVYHLVEGRWQFVHRHACRPTN